MMKRFISLVLMMSMFISSVFPAITLAASSSDYPSYFDGVAKILGISELSSSNIRRLKLGDQMPYAQACYLLAVARYGMPEGKAPNLVLDCVDYDQIVADNSKSFLPYIELAMQKGIIRGIPVEGSRDVKLSANRANTRLLTCVAVARATDDIDANFKESSYNNFRDIPSWATDAVDRTCSRGLMVGVSSSRFGSDDAMLTRDMFIVALRILNETKRFDEFEDAVYNIFDVRLTIKEASTLSTNYSTQEIPEGKTYHVYFNNPGDYELEYTLQDKYGDDYDENDFKLMDSGHVGNLYWIEVKAKTSGARAVLHAQGDKVNIGEVVVDLYCSKYETNPTNVQFDASTIYLKLGTSIQPKLTVRNYDGVPYDKMTFSVEDTNIVRCNEYGVLTPKKIGKTTFTVRLDDGKTASVTVRVEKGDNNYDEDEDEDEATRITFDKSGSSTLTLKMDKSSTQTVYYTVKPSDARVRIVSEDTSIARVNKETDDSGSFKITYRDTKEATSIKLYSYENYNYLGEVKVKYSEYDDDDEDDANKITFDQSNSSDLILKMENDSTKTIYYTTKPSGAKVRIESDNTKIATVNKEYDTSGSFKVTYGDTGKATTIRVYSYENDNCLGTIKVHAGPYVVLDNNGQEETVIPYDDPVWISTDLSKFAIHFPLSDDVTIKEWGFSDAGEKDSYFPSKYAVVKTEPYKSSTGYVIECRALNDAHDGSTNFNVRLSNGEKITFELFYNAF